MMRETSDMIGQIKTLGSYRVTGHSEGVSYPVTHRGVMARCCFLTSHSLNSLRARSQLWLWILRISMVTFARSADSLQITSCSVSNEKSVLLSEKRKSQPRVFWSERKR